MKRLLPLNLPLMSPSLLSFASGCKKPKESGFFDAIADTNDQA